MKIVSKRKENGEQGIVRSVSNSCIVTIIKISRLGVAGHVKQMDENELTGINIRSKGKGKEEDQR